MSIRIDKFMLEKIKRNIRLKEVKHIGNYFNDFQNCYAYALNIDLPMNINIGDISDAYDPDYGIGDFEKLFIKDCETLDINVEKVDAKYELSEENSWLVALYGTDYYMRYYTMKSDFHFVKKNYKSKWKSKFINEKPKYKDALSKKIINPETALFAIKDDEDNIVKYKYIGTYKLTR